MLKRKFEEENSGVGVSVPHSFANKNDGDINTSDSITCLAASSSSNTTKNDSVSSKCSSPSGISEGELIGWLVSWVTSCKVKQQLFLALYLTGDDTRHKALANYCRTAVIGNRLFKWKSNILKCWRFPLFLHCMYVSCVCDVCVCLFVCWHPTDFII